MYRALDELGLETSQLELVTGIGEDETCYQKASELAQTCDIVFADSFRFGQSLSFKSCINNPIHSYYDSFSYKNP